MYLNPMNLEKWQHWMVKLFFPMQMNLYMMKW